MTFDISDQLSKYCRPASSSFGTSTAFGLSAYIRTIGSVLYDGLTLDEEDVIVVRANGGHTIP